MTEPDQPKSHPTMNRQIKGLCLPRLIASIGFPRLITGINLRRPVASLSLLFLLISLSTIPPTHAQIDPYGVYLGKSDSLKRPAPTKAEFKDQLMQELGSAFYFMTPQGAGALYEISLPGICYSLRYPWHVRGNDFSISSGAYSTIGLTISNLGSYFMLQLPLLTEVNFGRGSTLQNPRNLGVSAGLGPELTTLSGLNITQVNLTYSLALRFRLAGRPVYLRYGSSIGTIGRGDYQVYSLSLGNSFF